MTQISHAGSTIGQYVKFWVVTILHACENTIVGMECFEGQTVRAVISSVLMEILAASGQLAIVSQWKSFLAPHANGCVNLRSFVAEAVELRSNSLFFSSSNYE
jgi:hypothetical protein